MRVLVCGGRGFHNPKRVKEVMDGLHKEKQFSLVITGGALGADQSADAWATSRGIDRVIFPANWTGRGNPAGPFRNGLMLQIAKPDLVVAFPGNAGTSDMTRKARAAGIEVRMITFD